MCPPATANQGCPPEIGLYWTDEQVVLMLVYLLDEYTRGFPLPSNVIDYINPFEYLPSNLPDGIWFLVPSSEKKETDCGFWKPKGEDCEINSKSERSGWRSTLEYFRGQASDGQRTDWLMQEYTVSQKGICYKNKTKESKSLCRVFCSGTEMHSKECKTDVDDVKHIELVASINQNANSTPTQHSTSESEAKRISEVGLFPVAVADRLPNSSPEDFPELECVLRGDFLELDDLEDPKSHASSSENSSRASIASDEYFDSIALLQDLDEEYSKDMQGYSFRTYLRKNKVVVQSPPSDSLLGEAERSPTGSTFEARLTGERVLEHTTKAVSNGTKKASTDIMEKLKKYLCFVPF